VGPFPLSKGKVSLCLSAGQVKASLTMTSPSRTVLWKPGGGHTFVAGAPLKNPLKRSGVLLGNLPLSVAEMTMLRTPVNAPPPFRMSVTSATIEALLPFTSRHVTRPVTTALGSKSVLVNLTVPGARSR
jgi:hypothetical protein